MIRIKLFQVDAFTSEKFTGNSAGVVLDADHLSEKQMQQIARELDNSETAFVLSSDGPDHDVRVRFFTPTTEVPLCGHATIAAHYVRAYTGKLSSQVFKHKTGAGVLPVEILSREDTLSAMVTSNLRRVGRFRLSLCRERQWADLGGSRSWLRQQRSNQCGQGLPAGRLLCSRQSLNWGSGVS